MKLHVIEAGNFKLDGGAMFGVVPKSLWQRTNPADENNMCNWAMRCLLVEHEDRKILIDVGIGNKQDEKFFKHFFLSGDTDIEKALNNKGFSAEDITDVFLTHLHFDHCGGAIKRNADGKLVTNFPNATYWSNERHWKWATEPNPREKASFLKENILPIKEAGQLSFLSEGEELIPGFGHFYANGHTDAMMIPKINLGARTLIYMADLLPSIGHIPLPYVMGYDMKPMITLKEKDAFLKEAEKNNYILFFEHDPINECCTLKQGNKYIEKDECFSLSDIC